MHFHVFLRRSPGGMFHSFPTRLRMGVPSVVKVVLCLSGICFLSKMAPNGESLWSFRVRKEWDARLLS